MCLHTIILMLSREAGKDDAKDDAVLLAFPVTTTVTRDSKRIANREPLVVQLRNLRSPTKRRCQRGMLLLLVGGRM